MLKRGGETSGRSGTDSRERERPGKQVSAKHEGLAHNISRTLEQAALPSCGSHGAREWWCCGSSETLGMGSVGLQRVGSSSGTELANAQLSRKSRFIP